MIKILLKSLREYKKSTILSIIIIMGEVLMECFMPLVTKLLTDNMNRTDGDYTLVWVYAALLVVMATFALLFGMFAGKLSAKASCGFAANLRKDLFNSVQGFSFSNIDKFSSSSLVTRMTTDVTNVQMAFMMVIRTAIRSPLMIVFSIVISFIINPDLSWIFVIVIPVIFMVLLIIIIFGSRAFNRVFKKYDVLNESIDENISGMRTVKSYVREDYEKNKFNQASHSLMRDFRHAERIVIWNQPIMQTGIYFTFIFVIFTGALMVIKNSSFDGTTIIFNGLTIQGISSLLVYGMQSLMGLMMLSMVVIMITMALESSRRIVEVLKEESSIKNPINPVFSVANGAISFKNVSFKYNVDAKKYALKDINIDINSGETIGIIGGTGSSKTTLINLIDRLYDTTKGEVYVGNKNVKEYDLVTLREAVGVVLQKNVLFSGTIKENIKWGNELATDEEVIKVAKMACCDEFIDQFKDGYDTYIEQGGTNVSGGQKQRLCIARALLKNPKILILDDSTSAVDTKTDSIIRNSLKNEAKDTTKIIIAQRISSIQDSDKIIILNNGTIDDIGNHEELLKRNKIYQEVYFSQNKIGGNTNENNK